MHLLRIFLGLLALCSACGASEFDVLRQQYVEYYASQSVSESTVTRCLDALSDEGQWPDVDYKSKRRGSWPTAVHLKHMDTLAMAYVNPDTRYFQSNEVKNAILMAMEHWMAVDYQNPNWWNGKIGTPKSFCKVMLLLGDELPEATYTMAKDKVLGRTEMGMTGQNKVWLAGIAFMKALMAEDPDAMKHASDTIWSELRVSTDEGIQPDWSFHQHGPQQQFGNYGLAFGADMLNWAMILRGTPYAPNEAKLEILRNYMVHGSVWVLWGDSFDFSACGRQIDNSSPKAKARSLRRQLEGMKVADPTHHALYNAALRWPNTLIGHKYFWRSDMAVHRRPDWYASVKMSSTRVVGTETCNSENMAGLHAGDGALMLYLNAKTDQEMPALWDWRRLPGTTCDQGLNQLEPKGASGSYGGSNFVGGLEHRKRGVSTMVYSRNQLKAHKAWFFAEDTVICLGAGIDGETLGSVATSIQQTLRSGRVVTANGEFGSGTCDLPAGAWVHHDGIGYELLSPSQLQVSSVRGNWNVVFPTRGDRPVSADVFSLWTDHGQSPTDASYAYVLHPQTSVEELEQRCKALSYQVLSNTKNLQAIQGDGVIQAVFYTAGTLRAKNGSIIKVDAPCIISLLPRSLSVVDPSQQPTQLTVTVGGRNFPIDLPGGAEAGRSVELPL